MTDRLDGRVVLVTGSGAGIGRALCLACADAGAVVVVTGPGDNGQETATLVTDRGGRALFVRTDVAVAADVDRAVAVAAETFGGLDAVVHNATSRLSSRVEPIDEIDDGTWADHVAVSLRGTYHCARSALPHLRAGVGRFLVMTSPAALEGSVALPAYGAVKGALRGMAKSLAVEWGPLGITVNCVSPLAQTPALDNAYRENPALAPRLRAVVPLGRVGDPEHDIAPVVVFLLSDAGRYITGQTIVVDGGRFTGL
ncbi:MAG TPA: SDR family NAD(P)-dependent oxidoreductase [Acidimicrobiales bacterium]|nr:SDR family NAD(P)-dependent oxidoreductase [Acidimicrobiales bacterium]